MKHVEDIRTVNYKLIKNHTHKNILLFSLPYSNVYRLKLVKHITGE